MSRKGSTGSSLGICNCWSLSVVSIASVVNSGSLTIAMGRVLYRYQDLLSPSVFNLWKVYVQHTVAKLRRSFADAALGTQVRKNLRRLGRLFFSPEILSLVLQILTLICSAVIPGSSTRIEIIVSVSQRSTGGAQVPEAKGSSASVASCKAE